MKLNVKLVGVTSVVVILVLAAMWWILQDRRLEASSQDALSVRPQMQLPAVSTDHPTSESILEMPQQEAVNSTPLIEPAGPSHAGSAGVGDTSAAEPPAALSFPGETQVLDARGQAVQIAAMRLRELAERKASPEELVQGLTELKKAAGSSGLPGIDLDSVIQSMNLAAATLKQSDQMRQLIEKYEHTKDPAVKEEILKISQELTKSQKSNGDRSAKPSR